MDYVVASDGAILYIDAMSTVIDNNVDGTVNFLEVSQSGKTYRQSFTYTDGILTGVSNWVLQ